MANQDRWRQNQWSNDSGRGRDDDPRDWRSSGDDWRRSSGDDWRRSSGDDWRRGSGDDWRRGSGDDWRRGSGDDWRRLDMSRDHQDRGPRGEGGWADHGRSRDTYGGSDEMRRRDVSGYGGAMGGGDFGEDRWGQDRSYGGQDRYYGGQDRYYGGQDRYYGGRGGQDRGYEGSRSNYGGSYGTGTGSNFYDRDYGGSGGGWGRSYGSGWNDDWRSGRDQGGRERNERGFFDRAADEVASWFGDTGAEQRREQDQRGRGPKGYSRSDERIREDVSDRLTDDPYVDAVEIEVTVTSSEVTLSGMAKSREHRRRAEDIAERVSGVTHVQNNIRVRTEQSGGLAGSSTTGANIGQTAFGRDTSGQASGSGTDTGASGSTAPSAGSSSTGMSTAGRTGKTGT